LNIQILLSIVNRAPLRIFGPENRGRGSEQKSAISIKIVGS